MLNRIASRITRKHFVASIRSSFSSINIQFLFPIVVCALQRDPFGSLTNGSPAAAGEDQDEEESRREGEHFSRDEECPE